MSDLWAALCLVAVLEGLLLLVAPGGWKRAVEQLQAMSDSRLRIIGGILMGLGLVSLLLLRAA